MPSSSDQTRVGRTLTLGGGAESSLEVRDIELSVSPKDIRTSPYDLCANRSDRRQSREGDRWFESTSLQRRVLRHFLAGLFEVQTDGRSRRIRQNWHLFSFNAPWGRGLVLPSRCGMVAAEFLPVISGSRGRSIGRGVMKRKTVALFLLFGVGLVIAALGIGANLVPMAAAQNVCPPGQTFVLSQGGCVATQQPAVRCPEGQVFDAQTNRCATSRSAVRCPEGQEFDAQTNRCVTGRSAVRCPESQEFDARTNRCVTGRSAVRCPESQEFDARTNRCVTIR